jgi:small GTP-binding protein
MNIIKKICILGSPGVGKSSTVARYVKGIYSEAYHSTIGVKIDKKNIRYDNLDVTLILWDLAGEDSFEKYRQAYLRGASGLIFIADGTRPETLQHALAMQKSSTQNIESPIPHIFLINKKDLHDQWKIPQFLLDTISQEHTLLLTSAKTGETINEAFQIITKLMLTTKYTSYIPPTSPPETETTQPPPPIDYPDLSDTQNPSQFFSKQAEASPPDSSPFQ